MQASDSGSQSLTTAHGYIIVAGWDSQEIPAGS